MNDAFATLCVFCGSSRGRRPEFVELAGHVGHRLAELEIRIVYGGAQVGVMGVMADAALAAGGEVIGVIPGHMAGREVAHPGLTDLHVVDSMHQRKALMAELAEGFVALPGGLGTLEEFAEVLSWAQLGLHDKPTGLLNMGGYYVDLVRFFDRAAADGFLRHQHRNLLTVAGDLDSLLAAMRAGVASRQ